MPADFESCTRTFHGIRDRRKRDQNAQSAVAGNQVLEEPVDGTRHIRERAGLFGKPDQKGIIEKDKAAGWPWPGSSSLPLCGSGPCLSLFDPSPLWLGQPLGNDS